jgi:hypothetical protein
MPGWHARQSQGSAFPFSNRTSASVLRSSASRWRFAHRRIPREPSFSTRIGLAGSETRRDTLPAAAPQRSRKSPVSPFGATASEPLRSCFAWLALHAHARRTAYPQKLAPVALRRAPALPRASHAARRLVPFRPALPPFASRRRPPLRPFVPATPGFVAMPLRGSLAVLSSGPLARRPRTGGLQRHYRSQPRRQHTRTIPQEDAWHARRFRSAAISVQILQALGLSRSSINVHHDRLR